MGLFEGGFGVIRGEVWVNALQGTLACCTACASATVYHIYPRPPRAGLPEALLVAIVAAMYMVRVRKRRRSSSARPPEANPSPSPSSHPKANPRSHCLPAPVGGG